MHRSPLTHWLFPLALLAASSLSAQDWTTWRGPHHNGVSTESKWNPLALNNPKVLWKTNVGHGHASTTLHKNRLYTMGTRFEVSTQDTAHPDTTCQDRVICLDAKTGKTIWQFDFDATPSMFMGPRATPILDGNRLYAINWAGQFYCLNAKNGKLIWKRDVMADSLTKNHRWGISGSPVVEGDLVYLNIAKHGAAFNKKTGELIWASPYAVTGLATPKFFDWHGKRLVAMIGIDSLYAVEPKTGQVQWTYRWHSFTDPTFLDKDHLFLMGNLLRGKKYNSVLLDMSADTLRAIAGSRNLLAHFTTAVVIDNHAYGFAHVRRRQPFQCVDLLTGEEKWSEDFGEYGAHIAADGKLIILKGNGELVIAQASPEGFKPLSSAKLLEVPPYKDQSQHQKDWCWTIPVLSRGRLYVRNTTGDLICVDVSK